MYEFRNIPYAAPPVGPLRWQPPSPVTKTLWSKTLPYNPKEIWCKQFFHGGHELGTEDCLVLTVRQPSFSKKTTVRKPSFGKVVTARRSSVNKNSARQPSFSQNNIVKKNRFSKKTATRKPSSSSSKNTTKTNKTTSKQLLPVLVWIHGGALGYGSNNWYYPDENCSASLGMVTVSINYRLNIFGFLSIKDMWKTKNRQSHMKKSFGNFGIMDMIAALKWVRDNIQSFGGDPTRVTVLGQSAGAAAIYSLIVSQQTDGLFYKAIVSSGYPIAEQSDYHRAEQRYGDLFRRDTGCANSTDIMRCLRALPAAWILRAQPALRHPIKPSLSPWFFPYNEPADIYPMQVVDHHFIPATIGKLKTSRKKGLKVLIGSTAQEGHPVRQADTWNGMKLYLKPKINSFVGSDGFFPIISEMYKKETLNKHQQLNKNSNNNNNNTTQSQLLHMTMASDVLLGCQTNQIAANLSRVPGIKVYRYVHRQAFSFNPWRDSPEPYAYHGIDTDALFGFKHTLYKPTRFQPRPVQQDWKLVSNVRTLFKRFVHDDADDDSFHGDYFGKTIEIKKDDVVASDKVYHKEMCEQWRRFGFLRRSWGQLNMKKKKTTVKKVVL